MKTFIAVAHKDEGSAYGVTFPDLPGCFSAADDLDTLVANASEALDLWFDDVPEVQPRSMEAIRAAAADELAKGAFLVAIPRVTRSGRSVRVNVSLDSGTLAAIDAAAAARKLTRSAFIADAARNEITMTH